MGSPESIENVDRIRQELEANVRKLRSALRYWQSSEAEYEGLREDVEGLSDEVGVDELVISTARRGLLGAGTDVP